MKVSKSKLTSFITCPGKYYLSYELRIRPVRISSDFLIGFSTHHLISSHFSQRKNGETCNLQELLKDYWSSYTLENADFTTQEDLEAASLESLGFAELFLEETALEPVEVEYEFSLPLINVVTGEVIPDLELVGFIDLIDRVEERNRVIDIKTRAKKPDEFQAQVSLELTCYAYWLRFLDDREVVPVSYANIIKNKKPYIQWQDQERSSGDFVELFHTAKTVSENIRDKRFYRNPGVHCNWCDYKPICARELDEVRQLFGEEAFEVLRGQSFFWV